MVTLLPKEHKIIEKGFMEYKPFGVDENGERIEAWDGKSIIGTIEYMMECVSQRAEEEARPRVGEEEARHVGKQAAEEALNELIKRLNGAIRDKLYHVSREYLMNERNYYSYEFRQFLNEYARLISGDENFSFNRAYKSIRPSIIRLFRPFPLRRIYALLSPIVGRYTDTYEVKVVKTTRNSATIQMRVLEKYRDMAGPYLLGCIENDCLSVQGAFSAIPPARTPGLPPATINENRCQLWGDECCEWEYTWQEPMPKGNIWLWLGGLMSFLALVYLVYLRARFPGSMALANVAFATFPLLVGWLVKKMKIAQYEREEKETMLMEQRQFSEEQYDELQAVNADLQMANVELKQKVSELTTVHKVGTAIASVLDLNSLLDMVLRVVTEELDFDRAMVLLVDEERQVLTHGRGVGDSQELVAFVEQMEMPLVGEAGLLAQTALRGEPILVEDVSSLPEGADRNLMETLRTKSFVAVPLKVKKRVIGVVAADNLHSARTITEADQNLLLTLGQQMATAIENARLYRQVEAYSQTLEEEVQRRTRDLLEEKNKLDVIFQNVADGLVVIDAGGCVVLTNPVFEAIVGEEGVVLAGRPLSEVLCDERLGAVVRHALVEVGEVFSVDVEVGSQVYKASACALQPDGDVSGVVTVLRDITREKEVDRMKTEFISTVSHELRTPLTSVLGFAKLIRKSFNQQVVPQVSADEGEGQRAVARISGNLDIIVSEGERLTRLINDVLDIAKMEAGKIEWRDRSFDLSALLRQGVEGMQGLASGKGLPVRMQIEGALPLLVGDPDRILQVLTNLLSNAIKFTERGEVVVSARRLGEGEEVHGWRAAAGSGGGVVVSVADTGVGIPAEEMSRLFERFQQVGDTLRDKPKGTGLGLAICREIVTHYGGVIWAESSAGVGSTFYFTMPSPSEGEGRVEAAPVYVPTVISEIRRRVNGALPASVEESPLVLIVDDEVHIRSLLVQELGEAGYRTLEAANGTEALALTRRHRPSIVLLDVMMPDISGFDVTRVLKSDPATASIPILILSIIEDREHGLALGADAYLTKPVESGRLLETISSLLAQEPERRTAMVAGQDRSVIEAITVVLREEGFEVVEAYDPRGAITTAREVQPDLVILDEMLSRLNDAEILKALRFQDPSRACTIIIVSGEKPSPLR